MLPKFRASHAYIAFDHLVRFCETWVQSCVIDSLGYTTRALSSRLVQRIVEIGLTGYVKGYVSAANLAGIAPDAVAVNSFAGLRVSKTSGAVQPGLKLFLQALVEFFVHWLHVSGVVMQAYVLGKKAKIGRATLLFGVGNESLFVNGSDACFVKFCRNGPITPLTDATRLIVQAPSTSVSTTPQRVAYSPFPLFELLKENPPDSSGLLQFFLRHMQSMAAYFRDILRCSPTCLLGRDYAYHALAEHLNNRHLIECVVITNANYSAQPLWMIDLPNRHFKTHMIWYSQNTIPIVYAVDGLKADLPNYRHMRVDESWVWTNAYADYLKSLSVQGLIHIVGPVLWQLPVLSEAEKKSNDEVVLVVFDVTPVTDNFADKVGFLGNYYSAANMQAFLNDVEYVRGTLEHVSQQRVKVKLKHKRAYATSHDSAYIDLVARLHTAGNVELVPYNENIYSLIASADMAIVVPYSSPAYVADALGVPSVFFDPTGEILPIFDSSEHIYFAAGKDALVQVICEHIRLTKAISP